MNTLSDRVFQELWEKDASQRSWFGRQGIRVAQILYGIIRKFADGQFNLQAMSLVYTTLLSLVPLLAVSFSVLKAFGVHNQMEPLLLELLYPLGEKGKEISARVMEFVGNIRVGVLGSLGIAMLFYTVISLVSKIEQAFNTIWRVANTRSLARRFSDYLSIILIGPVLIFTALGLAASAMSSEVVQWLASREPFGTLVAGLSSQGPYLLICGAFAFLYGFIPNTQVRLSAALIGGLFAGLLWYTTGRIFTNFVANSSNYSAIYSGFASAVLFMIWLYVGWLIVLVGAQVTFYLQNPRFLDPRSETAVLENRQKEALALEIMALIGRAHYFKQEPLWTLEALEARHNTLPPGVLVRLVKSLVKQGLLVVSKDNPPVYLPACDTQNISLEEVLRVARGERGTGTDLAPVEAVVAQLDAAILQTVRGRTVKDLILESPA